MANQQCGKNWWEYQFGHFVTNCQTKLLVKISHYMVGMGLEHGCKVATTLEIVKTT